MNSFQLYGSHCVKFRHYTLSDFNYLFQTDMRVMFGSDSAQVMLWNDLRKHDTDSP